MEHDKWVYMDAGYDFGFEGYMYLQNVNDGSAICNASAKFKNGKTYYFDKNGVAYSDKAHKKKITEEPTSKIISD